MDKCMKHLIEQLNQDTALGKFRTLSCCCGHGKYPMTIIMVYGHRIYELLTDITIPRTNRFYRKDKEGYYYIPEVMNK